MKHPATGGHALGTRSATATAVPTPTQSAQPPGTRPWRAPGPHPSPAWGSPAGLPSQLPHSLSRAEPGPAPPPPSPESPSLSLHPASPPAVPRAGQPSGAARWEPGERPSSLSPSVSATAAALTPEAELAGTKRLAPLRVPYHLLLRGAGPAGKHKQAGGVSAPGRERARGPGQRCRRR